MSWIRWAVAFSLLTAVLLIQPASAQHLSDNLTLWTSNSSFLSSLAVATSNPAGTFVNPQTSFSGTTGLQMSGLTQDFTFTGLQSLSTFSAPFNVVAQVAPIQGSANPFALYLVSADLTQYLILHANMSPTYQGFWANAPNVDHLDNLGEQFSPNFVPNLNEKYKVVIQVSATGVGTVKVYGGGRLLGTLSNLQAGTGPFYLVIGQRMGLAPTGSQVADWYSVNVTP